MEPQAKEGDIWLGEAVLMHKQTAGLTLDSSYQSSFQSLLVGAFSPDGGRKEGLAGVFGRWVGRVVCWSPQILRSRAPQSRTTFHFSAPFRCDPARAAPISGNPRSIYGLARVTGFIFFAGPALSGHPAKVLILQAGSFSHVAVR